MTPEGIARDWIGTPYRHQGRTRQVGADCLGLILGVWGTLYGDFPHVVPSYSADWNEARRDDVLWMAARQYLEPADEEPEQAGQVVLFRMRSGSVAKHLGVLSGDAHARNFIHAYQGHGVVESPLTDPWRRKIAARFAFPKVG